MRFIGLIGADLAGHTRLAQEIQRRGLTTAFGWEDLRRVASTSMTPVAAAFRSASSAGCLVPDELSARLWFEVAEGDDDTMLEGFPRNDAQYTAFTAVSGKPLSIVCIRATPDFIDRRREASGLGPIEQAHPGAAARIRAAQDAILRLGTRCATVLELDAETPHSVVVDAVIEHFWPGRPT